MSEDTRKFLGTNLIVTFLVVALAYLFFEFHFKWYTEQLRWLGVITTAIAVGLGVIAKYWPESETGLKGAIKKKLDAAAMGWILIPLLVLLITAHIATASVHVVRADGYGKSEDHVLLIQSESGDTLALFDLASRTNRLDSLLFFESKAKELTLTLDAAMFRLPIKRRFGILSTLSLRIPDDFPVRPYYPLYVFTGNGLMHVLPESRKDIPPRWTLDLSSGAFHARIDSLIPCDIYTGAPAPVLNKMIDQDVRRTNRELLESYWRSVDAELSPSAVSRRAEMLQRATRVLPTIPFMPGDSIRITLSEGDTVKNDTVIVIEGLDNWQYLAWEYFKE